MDNEGLRDIGNYWGERNAQVHVHGSVLARVIDAILADDPTNLQPGQWYDWSGGECPVDPETLVGLEYRDGTTESKGVASDHYWPHDENPDTCDIVRFRIVPEEPTKATREAMQEARDGRTSYESADALMEDIDDNPVLTDEDVPYAIERLKEIGRLRPKDEEPSTLPTPDEVTEALRAKDDEMAPWQQATILAAAVRELAWFTNQTPYPYWRRVEECDRADACLSLAIAVEAMDAKPLDGAGADA